MLQSTKSQFPAPEHIQVISSPPLKSEAVSHWEGGGGVGGVYTERAPQNNDSPLSEEAPPQGTHWS